MTRRSIVAGGLAWLLVLTSCGGSDATSSGGEVVEPAVSTSAPADLAYTDDVVDYTDSAAPDDATESPTGMISDDGVLDAAIIILIDGDIEVAMADGRVTEAEVDSAIVALETGTLADYMD